MIAYDTDVLVELLKGHPTYAAKARAIPKEEQFVPIVVVEEIQRGRLNSIRQAEAGKARISLERTAVRRAPAHACGPRPAMHWSSRTTLRGPPS
jgi:predicted nucleic acid-binding protein